MSEMRVPRDGDERDNMEAAARMAWSLTMQRTPIERILSHIPEVPRLASGGSARKGDPKCIVCAGDGRYEMWFQGGKTMHVCECCRPAPSEGRGAETGWMTMTDRERIFHGLSWDKEYEPGSHAAFCLAEALAQRSRADAAEREREEMGPKTCSQCGEKLRLIRISQCDGCGEYFLAPGAMDWLAAHTAALRAAPTAAEAERQYTCPEHRDEVKKGGRCCWCALTAAASRCREVEKIAGEAVGWLDKLGVADPFALRSRLSTLHEEGK